MDFYIYILISLGVFAVIYAVVASVVARMFIDSAKLLEDLDWNEED
jgi:hypothetical protein